MNIHGITTDMKSRYTIGIDPGKETGLANYDRQEKRFVFLMTTYFCGAMKRVKQYQPSEVYKVIIELPLLPNAKVNKSVWHKGAKTRAAIGRTGVNVGGVIREAELLIQCLLDSGYDVIAQHPQGKVDTDTFQAITGYTERTNPHTRDAGMLCWGL